MIKFFLGMSDGAIDKQLAITANNGDVNIDFISRDK